MSRIPRAYLQLGCVFRRGLPLVHQGPHPLLQPCKSALTLLVLHSEYEK